MMKHCFLRIKTNRYWLKCLLLLAISIPVLAESPDLPGAKKFVDEYFSKAKPAFVKGKSIKDKLVELQYQSTNKAETPLFVFQQEANGFVIVAQKNHTFCIVGYSDKGNFQQGNIPPQLQSLMKFYEDSLDFINSSTRSTQVGIPVVEPLLDKYEINLNQYNHNEVGTCPTGCVATAVTQIMLYHAVHLGKPIKGYGYHCYDDGKHGQICADFENADYTDNNKLLSLHVGNVMEMLYCDSPYGSVPRKGIHGIKDHFNYYVGNASPDDDYVKNEIDQGRPVYAALRGLPVGHAVVLDGYDDRGYYHVNFGWGGSTNGYYLMNKSELIGFSPFTFSTNIFEPAIITPVVIPTLPADSLALVPLHNALGGTSVTGWDLTEPVFTWNGVLTSNGRVIELLVYSDTYHPTGQSLVPEIGNLSALKKLHIGACLHGNIPFDHQQFNGADGIINTQRICFYK